jgi:hypothetical protein
MRENEPKQNMPSRHYRRALASRATPDFMPKNIDQWLLFTYVGGQFTPLGKPFKKKEHAERAREKYPERQRRVIGLGRLPQAQ